MSVYVKVNCKKNVSTINLLLIIYCITEANVICEYFDEGPATAAVNRSVLDRGV